MPKNKMNVYCHLGGHGRVEWNGCCDRGCKLHWTAVWCDHCGADITRDFDPYVGMPMLW